MCRKQFTLILLSITFLGLFSGCSSGRKILKSDFGEAIFFPLPPDTARIQFLTRYSNSGDITGGRSKFKAFVAGREKPLPILKPYGLAIHNGTLFIVDAAVGGLELIDIENRTFNYFIPSGRGNLQTPLNCFVDDGGNLYITDVARKQVVIFNKNRDYIAEIGGDENFKPTDISVTKQRIFVTDPKNNRINIYDKTNFKLLDTFPDAEQGDESFLYNPTNILVTDDEIYITDFGDSRIKIFTHSGEYISSVGTYGKGLGQFVRPKGISVDKEKNLFVVDAGFENIQIFDQDLQLLMFFGGPYKGPGDMYLPANVVIDYEHTDYYKKFVHPDYKLKYLIFVTNQYGPDKVSVYGRIDPIMK